MKLFLRNVGQIDQVVKQGTVIRLVFEGGQGIVDTVQELAGLRQPFETKLKASIFHTDLCVDSAQNSVELLQREIELSSDGFRLTVGLPENVFVVEEEEKRIVKCDAALYKHMTFKAAQAALSDVSVWQGSFFIFTEYILNLGVCGIIMLRRV